MTSVFLLHDGWHAIWNGRLSAALFKSKGAAEAWIASCDACGHWRA